MINQPRRSHGRGHGAPGDQRAPAAACPLWCTGSRSASGLATVGPWRLRPVVENGMAWLVRGPRAGRDFAPQERRGSRDPVAAPDAGRRCASVAATTRPTPWQPLAPHQRAVGAHAARMGREYRLTAPRRIRGHHPWRRPLVTTARAPTSVTANNGRRAQGAGRGQAPHKLRSSWGGTARVRTSSPGRATRPILRAVAFIGRDAQAFGRRGRRPAGHGQPAVPALRHAGRSHALGPVASPAR